MALELHLDTITQGNLGSTGIGLVLRERDGGLLAQVGRFLDDKTELAAAGQSLLAGLELVDSIVQDKAVEATELAVFSTSEWLVRQLTGQGHEPAESLAMLVAQAQMRLLSFDTWRIIHSPSDEPSLAAPLAEHALEVGHDVDEPGSASTRTSGRASSPRSVIVRVVQAPDAGTCPEPCLAGEVLEFGEVAPAHMCLNALEAVLGVTMASKRDESEVVDQLPIAVECARPGCRARFEISLS